MEMQADSGSQDNVVFRGKSHYVGCVDVARYRLEAN